MNNLITQTIKGYELHEQVGAGGFGAVYRAYQTTVGREVAIKVILPQYANHPDFIRRFEVEAQLVARLEHPHIVPMYDYWRDPEGAYLVMRWLPGNLRTAIQRGSWSLEAASRLLEQMAAALTIAHREGIVHRDIKPDNILLDEDENAYLADFGIAKDLNMGGSITDSGGMIGSPDYIAPEQIKGETVTPRTDIYSLGLVMYEILTCQKPYGEATTPYARINSHLNTPLPVITEHRPNLPAAFNEVLQTATAKDPGQRYANVQRFAAAFKAAIPIAQRALVQPLPDALTQRESDILKSMVDGLSNKEIAKKLVLTLETVRWYLKQIYIKLDVHGRAQAIDRARRLNLFIDGQSTGSSANIALADPSEPTAHTFNLRPVRSLSTSQLVNPYKGLRAFQETDAADFFGRAALTEQLLARLGESGESSRFLAVVGPSGSGKSSVVKAGLIPALRKGALPNSERWFITDMLPGTHPFEELEAALLRVSISPQPDLLHQIAEDRRGLVRASKRVLPADQDTELLLVIDQFEELFTLLPDEKVRAHFIDNLLSATSDPRSRVRIVLTLRADFYDKPLFYPRLAELMRSHTEVVVPLTHQELERAIAGPAERVGMMTEPGLVTSIINDIGEQPGTLPLLQYALTELFERREGMTLLLEDYRATGGISGSLARRAEELYGELEEPAQTAARELFLRLVTLGEGTEDTRRRVVQAEITSLSGDERAMDEVLTAFGRYRLMTFDRDPVTRGPTVEIAHEALIREWTRLRGWLGDSRDNLRVHRRLMSAAQEWVYSKHDASFLASGVRLSQFQALAASGQLALNELEQNYLRTSMTEHEAHQAEESARQQREYELARQAAESAKKTVAAQRRATNRLRYLVVILVVAALGALALSGFALRSEQSALSAEATSASSLNLFAISENKRLAAAAESLAQTGNSQDAELAALLSLQALKFGPSFAAYSALNDASANLNQRLVFSEKDIVTSVAFSADGRMALIGTRDGSVHERDAQTGQVVRVLGGAGRIPIFSGDGRFVLTDLADGTAALWDAKTGQQLHTFNTIDTWNSGVFSPDDRYILTGSAGAARLWDAATGDLLRTFGTNLAVTSVALSRDGRLALTGSRDKVAILWDIASGQQIHVFTGHSDTVSAVTFSQDGKLIATASRDHTIRLWDAATGTEVHQLTDHTAAATSVAFSPDGKLVASGGFDHMLLIWDAASGDLIHTILGDTESVTSIAFSSDSTSILSGSADNTARLWSLQTPSGTLLLKGHTNDILSIAISPDDKTILTGSNDGTAILWNVHTGQPIHTFVGQAIADISYPSVTAVDISPDNRYAFIGGDGITPNLWNLATGQRIRSFAVNPPLLSGAKFSPDGKYIATIGNKDNKVTLWDVSTGQLVRIFQANVIQLQSVAFSYDSKYVFAGGAGGSREQDSLGTMWDVATGQIVRTFVSALPSGVQKSGNHGYDIEPSADGKYVLITADRTAKLLNANTGEEVQTFSGHTGPLSVVALSPDGKYVLTRSVDDQTTRLWDTVTGQVLRTFPNRANAISMIGLYAQVAFSHDGSYLVTFSDGFTPEIISLNYQGSVGFACAHLFRDLTDVERTKYGIVGTQPSCPQFDQPAPSDQQQAVLPTWTPIPTGTLPVWTPVASPTAPEATVTP